MEIVHIITEGTAQTGMGHLSRCSALYDAFRLYGFAARLIVNGGDRARAFLGGRQAEYFDWASEPERIPRGDIAVVDSYLAGRGVYEYIAANSAQAVYIDDYSRMDYPAGLVVDGVECFMLRSEFWDVPTKVIDSDISMILVTMGAGDTGAPTEEVVKLIAENFPGVETVVPRGVNAGRMKELMTECDIAVSAAGQTSGELARCGTPSLLIQTADNQAGNIQKMIAAGFIEKDSTLGSLVEDIKTLRSAEVRRQRSAAGQKAVDGRGALRVARAAVRELYISRLTMRKAEERDLMPLFRLANDPLVRANSHNTAAIAADEHREWFSRAMPSIYIFEIGGDFAAQVRLDVMEDETVVSISIAERYRGHGLGAELLHRALHDRSPVTAYIKSGNTASQRTFAAAGFHNTGGEKWVKL